MTNSDIAAVLEQTADLIELTEGNPYRARAFQRAARTLQDLEEPASSHLADGTLTDVDGIGDAMADHISDVVASGTFPLHDELLNAVPPGLLDLLRVNGLGTKRTRRLWNELGITSLDDLEAAADTGRIASLDGFGQKTQQNILDNVRRLRTYESKWRSAEAWSAVRPLLHALRQHESVVRAEPTGPLRRALEVVERVDLLVATEDPEAVTSWLGGTLPSSPDHTEEGLDATLEEGLPLRVHFAPPQQFGTAWWSTTGAPAHCETLEQETAAPANHSEEQDLYDAAGRTFVPPELREGRGELDAAAAGTIPDLITTDDLVGCLHNHSTYSDGADSLRDMAAAAREKGFTYFGICDHSQSLQIADGLSPAEVRQQQAEIEQLNAEYAENSLDFRIFSGIESDILRDGSLDYEKEVLSRFDFVVASVHTGFSMTETEATDRILQAVRNPFTRILGHPTGRLLLSREGYPLDHARVIAECAEEDVAIELNANPYRLDLDWRWVRHATDRGVLISINPDAHATDEIDYVRWGVAVARKGWLTADQCLNAKSRAEFSEWLDTASSVE
ncbi:MAG: helix-hairpin-helix domain-containing protein [Salinibacter sp.]